MWVTYMLLWTYGYTHALETGTEWGEAASRRHGCSCTGCRAAGGTAAHRLQGCRRRGPYFAPGVARLAAPRISISSRERQECVRQGRGRHSLRRLKLKGVLGSFPAGYLLLGTRVAAARTCSCTHGHTWTHRRTCTQMCLNTQKRGAPPPAHPCLQQARRAHCKPAHTRPRKRALASARCSCPSAARSPAAAAQCAGVRVPAPLPQPPLLQTSLAAAAAAAAAAATAARAPCPPAAAAAAAAVAAAASGWMAPPWAAPLLPPLGLPGTAGAARPGGGGPDSERARNQGGVCAGKHGAHAWARARWQQKKVWMSACVSACVCLCVCVQAWAW